MKLSKRVVDAVRGSVGVAVIMASGCVGGSAVAPAEPETVIVATQEPLEQDAEADPIEQEPVQDQPVEHEPVTTYDNEHIPPPCGRG